MANSKIKPQQLVIRCYAEKKAGHWQAFCLEFDLAVQGESYAEVKAKLEEQTKSYVQEALTEDSEFVHELLNRRAPLYHFVKFYFRVCSYHLAKSLNMAKSFNSKNLEFKPFCEPIPLIPA